MNRRTYMRGPNAPRIMRLVRCGDCPLDTSECPTCHTAYYYGYPRYLPIAKGYPRAGGHLRPWAFARRVRVSYGTPDGFHQTTIRFFDPRVSLDFRLTPNPMA